jgi:hypothetical protein
MIENPYESQHETHRSPPMAAKTDSEAEGRQRLIRWIMLAVILWGVFLAAGAWLSSHDWRRPAIVMACVFGFLGFWQAMLVLHRRP